MPSNPSYRSSFWRELREARLRLDGYRRVAPGCTRRAVVADHIEARPSSLPTPCDADRLDNLRSLCASHDSRKQGGNLRTRGCDAEGWPLDPHHRGIMSEITDIGDGVLARPGVRAKTVWPQRV